MDIGDQKLGADIRQGFNQAKGGLKEAGKQRVKDLVQKNGYVAFQRKEAALKFQEDPSYANWICKYESGEYKFYPPQNDLNQKVEDNKILDIYKSAISDLTKRTFVSISMLGGNPCKCKYTLISSDKRTGDRKIIQDVVVDFDGKFSMETLPSLYNQLCGGMPAIDYEKENSISFQNIDSSKTIGLGNLSPSQMELVKNMKEFVDNANFHVGNAIHK